MDDKQLLKEFEDEIAARIKMFHVEQVEKHIVGCKEKKTMHIEANLNYAYPFPFHIGSL